VGLDTACEADCFASEAVGNRIVSTTAAIVSNKATKRRDRIILRSIRILFTRLNYPNVVISELEVRGFNFNFGHMAGRAILVRDWTTGRTALSNRLPLYCVASETTLIVISGILS
jgi:hypothetical protein